MAIVGPWAIAFYGDKVQWGSVPVPTKDGKSADETYTFPDAKNIGMYTSCKNQGTAWDVIKFATSKAQDGKLLDVTGQMPIRTRRRHDLRELLQLAPGVQGVRRPERPHHGRPDGHEHHRPDAGTA